MILFCFVVVFGAGLFLGHIVSILFSPDANEAENVSWLIEQGPDGHYYLWCVPKSGNGCSVVHAAGCAHLDCIAWREARRVVR
jgi:hypothetical protein